MKEVNDLLDFEINTPSNTELHNRYSEELNKLKEQAKESRNITKKEKKLERLNR